MIRPGQAAAVHVCPHPRWPPHNQDAADQLVPRRRQANVSWISLTLVGSTVVKGPRDYRRGGVQVDTDGVPRRHGYFGAGHDRSGHAERKDSGDDDCSPDAHGLLHGDCPGQPIAGSPGPYFYVTRSIVALRLFHARLQSKFFLFPKCNLCDNCRCFFAGKVHFSVCGKICVFVHCKVLCNLHGGVPEQTGHSIITRDA